MTPDSSVSEPFLDPRDAAYIATVEDAALRETILCTVTTYRRPDRIEVGDSIPDIPFLRLDTGEEIRLSIPPERPVVLFFGSYT